MGSAEARSRTTPAAVALALGVSAALVFGAGDAIHSTSGGAEALLVAAWVFGWTLLIWATIFGGLGAIQLVRGLAARRSPARSEVLLLLACAAVIVAVAWTHPLWGSGSGVG